MNPIDVIIASYLPRDSAAIVALNKEICETAGTKVRVHPTCLNACASRNRNHGLDLSTSSVRIMLDDDITGLPQDWVVDLVRVLDTFPRCVMVAPRLLDPSGRFGYMLGEAQPKSCGVTIVERQELPTACIAIRDNDIRFDEAYVGSGWEDTDYCAQLRQRYPQGLWMICEDVQMIHVHEMKNQRQHLDANRARYESKWGKPQGA